MRGGLVIAMAYLFTCAVIGVEVGLAIAPVVHKVTNRKQGVQQNEQDRPKPNQ